MSTKSSKQRRPRIEIAKAVHRLTREKLLTLEELATTAGVGLGTLLRWVMSGKGGVFLDGFHRPNVGWMSSVEALGRFRKADAERAGRGADQT